MTMTTLCLYESDKHTYTRTVIVLECVYDYLPNSSINACSSRILHADILVLFVPSGDVYMTEWTHVYKEQ